MDTLSITTVVGTFVHLHGEMVDNYMQVLLQHVLQDKVDFFMGMNKDGTTCAICTLQF